MLTFDPYIPLALWVPLALSAAGHLLFVVDARSADVSVVRTASRALFTILPTNRGPNAIAVKAFNQP